MKEILEKLKEENPYIYKCFRKELEYFAYKKNNNMEKNFLYGRLNITKKQTLLIKSCIKNNTDLYNNEIIEKILIYIDKIKYKETLKENYNSIDEIITSGNIKNRLKSLGIFTVGDLIEYKKDELKQIEGIGPKSVKSICDILEERKIIFLDNPILIKEKLSEKNCGIIPNIKTENEKNNIKKQLEILYKEKERLLEQLQSNEETTKKLEKKLGGKNENKIWINKKWQ